MKYPLNIRRPERCLCWSHSSDTAEHWT